jgi:hypothetical protein
MADDREVEWPARLVQIVNLLAAACLVAWISGNTIAKLFLGDVPWPDSVVDYHILYEQSRNIVNAGGYEGHHVFPYPPSAVVLFHGTAIGPFPVAAGIWLAVTLLATVGTFILGTRVVGLAEHHWRWALGLLAFAFTEYFIGWDLRSQNCNMVYCFLLVAALAALQSDRNVLSGMLLAASIALKLYPVLVVPYLWWIGRRRAFAATVGFMVLFFIVLPAAVFGAETLVQVYRSWLEQVRFIAVTLNQSEHPILIAIPYLLARKLGTDSVLALWLRRSLAVIWLGAVAICLVSRRDLRNKGGIFTKGLRLWTPSTPFYSRPPFADLAINVGILTLAPIVMSPYLEAYHGVVAILPILGLLQRALESWGSRVIASLALAGGWLALKLSAGEMIYRGLGIYVQMLLIVLALAAIRRRERRNLTQSRRDRQEPLDGLQAAA